MPNKKILICNAHDDIKINDFTSAYILTKYKEDSSFLVLSENVLWSDDITGNIEQNYKITINDDVSKNAMDDSSFLDLICKLENNDINVIGIMDRKLIDELAREEVASDINFGEFGDFLKSLTPAQQKHDQFMYNKLIEFNSDFIAIIGAHHIIQWLIEGKLDDTFQVIVPTYSDFLDNMVDRGKLRGQEWSDEAILQVQEIYNTIVNLDGIEVINIGDSSFELSVYE